MNLPRPGRRRIGRAARISSVFSTVTTVVASFVMDVTANQLSTLGRWVPWVVMAGGVAISVTLWRLGNRRTDAAATDTSLVQPLPHVDEPLGRDAAVAAVRERAAAHGLVVVRGPSGIGTSSVAIRAAHLLVAGETDQRYADLRGVPADDAAAAAVRVLRALGLGVRGSERTAARTVAAELRNTRRVLLIDNVAGAGQVAWVAHPVPGAYIVIAGHLQVDELREAADVAVAGLAPDEALALLRRQDTAPPPPRGLARMLGLVRGQPRHTIDARIKAAPKEAERLAAAYLQFPPAAIQVGRWLARNPQVGIAQLLHDVQSGGMASELRRIVGEMVAGASPGARQLLALLTQVPQVEYPDAAVAALADITTEQAGARLAELGERFLVYRTSRGARISPQGANLARSAPPRAVPKARTRLLAHYAVLAAAEAELLDAEQYAQAARWFAANDVTLQAVLGMPEPPRRAVRRLWTIADALDVWFARERRRDMRRETAELMRDRAHALGDMAAEATALVRLATIERRRRDAGRARRLLGTADALGHGRASWLPQLRTGWALWHEATHDLDAARNELLRVQRTRPQRDVEGRMTDLINLGAIDIKSEQYGSAVDRLNEAVRLARRAPSTGGRAHARELIGVAECVQGRAEPAEAAWSEAERLYASIGDEAGLARCRRHRAVCAGVPVPE